MEQIPIPMAGFFTALHIASAGEHCDIVEYLIQHGAQVNAEYAGGQTPLFTTNRQIAMTMLSAGATASPRDNGGHTSLHYTSALGSISVVRTLVRAKVDIDARNRHGQTAVWLACSCVDECSAENSLKIMEILLNGGASPDLASKDRKTPV